MVSGCKFAPLVTRTELMLLVSLPKTYLCTWHKELLSYPADQSLIGSAQKKQYCLHMALDNIANQMM